MDELAGEADTIESTLMNRFGMRGGGRICTDREVIMAAVEESKSVFQRQRSDINDKLDHKQNENKNHNENINEEEVNSDMDSEDDTEINELVVRRKTTANHNENSNNHNSNNNNNTNNNNNEKETKTQKFKRLEKNWSKSRRYNNIWEGDGALVEYGKLYERHQEEIKQKRKRKRSTKKKKSSKSNNKNQSENVQFQKEQEFCYKLGTIKIHLENENLDGVKPEDIIPYVSKHVKRFLCGQIICC